MLPSGPLGTNTYTANATSIQGIGVSGTLTNDQVLIMTGGQIRTIDPAELDRSRITSTTLFGTTSVNAAVFDGYDHYTVLVDNSVAKGAADITIPKPSVIGAPVFLNFLALDDGSARKVTIKNALGGSINVPGTGNVSLGGAGYDVITTNLGTAQLYGDGASDYWILIMSV